MSFSLIRHRFKLNYNKKLNFILITSQLTLLIFYLLEWKCMVANLVAPLDDLNEIVSFKVIQYNSIFIILL